MIVGCFNAIKGLKIHYFYKNNQKYPMKEPLHASFTTNEQERYTYGKQ